MADERLMIVGLVLFISFLHSTRSANIAFYGGPGMGSHFSVAAALGEELVRRGHNVTAIVSGDYLQFGQTTDEKYSKLFHFTITNQQTAADVLQRRLDRFARAAVSGNFIGELMKDMEEMKAEGLAESDAMLNDREFIQRLRGGNFDIMIIDPWFSLAFTLAEILDTRFIMMLPTPLEENVATAVGSPFNLALHPSMGSGFPYRMNFWERLRNFAQVKILPSLLPSIMKAADDYRKLRNIFPMTSTLEAMGRAELLLVNMDFAVEFALPLAPNVVPVGGITTKPVDALSEDLEEFIQSSGEAGVIVFAFGSYATFIKKEILNEFVIAFTRFPQKFIWKFDGDLPDDIEHDSSQFKTLSWIPQNDLLGHEKTKAFIFHGGNNGFYEAVDHGVPSVVIPLLVDQHDVASRIEHHGIGVKLEFKSLDADKIADAIRKVTEDKSYKQNAEKISAIFWGRNPVRPVEKAAFWVEHVIHHGGDYLRTPVNELTWYQYHLLDVYILLAMIATLILLILYYVLKLTKMVIGPVCCRRASRKDLHKKTSSYESAD